MKYLSLLSPVVVLSVIAMASAAEPKDDLPPAPEGKAWKIVWHDENAGYGQSEITMVREGKPLATIVIGGTPTKSAQLAVAELQYHVEKITGTRLSVVLVMLAAVPTAAQVKSEKAKKPLHNKPQRVEWFSTLGLGMFIHWGVDSQLGMESGEQDDGDVRMPMPGDYNEDADSHWLKKPVLKSRSLDDMENPATWSHHGRGKMTFTSERCKDGIRNRRSRLSEVSPPTGGGKGRTAS